MVPPIRSSWTTVQCGPRWFQKYTHSLAYLLDVFRRIWFRAPAELGVRYRPGDRTHMSPPLIDHEIDEAGADREGARRRRTNEQRLIKLVGDRPTKSIPPRIIFLDVPAIDVENVSSLDHLQPPSPIAALYKLPSDERPSTDAPKRSSPLPPSLPLHRGRVEGVGT